MQGYGMAFGLGLVAGMRSMSACAALTWAAGCAGRARTASCPPPSRPAPPSWRAPAPRHRPECWALTGRHAYPGYGALAGVAGAVAGTLLGRAARGREGRRDAPVGRERHLVPRHLGQRRRRGERPRPGTYGALAGVAGAVAGTLLGRAARGSDSRTAPGRARGAYEDDR
jgi:uncharacterized membrane protein